MTFEEAQIALEEILSDLGYAVRVAQSGAYSAENSDMLRVIERRVERAMDRAGDKLSGWRDDIKGTT